MSRTVANVTIRCTGADLRSAMQADAEDKAALLFFLLGAERKNLMLQGRTAETALRAACRLLHISDEALARLREGML